MTVSLEHVWLFPEPTDSGKRTVAFGLNNTRIRNITRHLREGGWDLLGNNGQLWFRGYRTINKILAQLWTIVTVHQCKWMSDSALCWEHYHVFTVSSKCCLHIKPSHCAVHVRIDKVCTTSPSCYFWCCAIKGLWERKRKWCLIRSKTREHGHNTNLTGLAILYVS